MRWFVLLTDGGTCKPSMLAGVARPVNFRQEGGATGRAYGGLR